MHPKRARSWKRRIQPRGQSKFALCLSRATGGQGVHREVESEGFAEKYRAVAEAVRPWRTGRPKVGAVAKQQHRSSPHYGGEGVLIHPPHQGVCGRHGMEDLGVTPGGLTRFPVGNRDKGSYKPLREVESDAE
jgi:hypothetical protein